MVDFRENVRKDIPASPHARKKVSATLFTELQEEVKHLSKSSTNIWTKKPKPNNTPKGFKFGCPNLNYFLISTWLIGQLYYSEKIWKIRPWKRYLTTFAAHPRRYGTIRAESFPGSIQNDTEMTGNQGLREQKATSATIIMLKKCFKAAVFARPTLNRKRHQTRNDAERKPWLFRCQLSFSG